MRFHLKGPKKDFSRRFGTQQSHVRKGPGPFEFVVTAFIVGVFLTIVASAINNGFEGPGAIKIISHRDDDRTFWTDAYERDEAGCIHFTDSEGYKRTLCGGYEISE